MGLGWSPALGATLDFSGPSHKAGPRDDEVRPVRRPALPGQRHWPAGSLQCFLQGLVPHTHWKCLAP